VDVTHPFDRAVWRSQPLRRQRQRHRATRRGSRGVTLRSSAPFTTSSRRRRRLERCESLSTAQRRRTARRSTCSTSTQEPTP
jgi:hypothetical protein